MFAVALSDESYFTELAAFTDLTDLARQCGMSKSWRVRFVFPSGATVDVGMQYVPNAAAKGAVLPAVLPDPLASSFWPVEWYDPAFAAQTRTVFL
jgi:hypothetical protein